MHNVFFERYKEFLHFVDALWKAIITRQTTPVLFVGQIILFLIFAVAALVFLSFTGLLQDPSGVFIPH